MQRDGICQVSNILRDASGRLQGSGIRQSGRCRCGRSRGRQSCRVGCVSDGLGGRSGGKQGRSVGCIGDGLCTSGCSLQRGRVGQSSGVGGGSRSSGKSCSVRCIGRGGSSCCDGLKRGRVGEVCCRLGCSCCRLKRGSVRQRGSRSGSVGGRLERRRVRGVSQRLSRGCGGLQGRRVGRIRDRLCSGSGSQKGRCIRQVSSRLGGSCGGVSIVTGRDRTVVSRKRSVACRGRRGNHASRRRDSRFPDRGHAQTTRHRDVDVADDVGGESAAGQLRVRAEQDGVRLAGRVVGDRPDLVAVLGPDKARAVLKVGDVDAIRAVGSISRGRIGVDRDLLEDRRVVEAPSDRRAVIVRVQRRRLAGEAERDGLRRGAAVRQVEELDILETVEVVDAVMRELDVVRALCGTQIDDLDAAVTVGSDRIILKSARIDRRVDAFAAVDDLGNAGSTFDAGAALDDVVAHAGEDPVDEPVIVENVATDVIIAIGADQHVATRLHAAAGLDQVANDRNRVHGIARVDDAGDEIGAVCVGRVVVLKDSDKPIAQKAGNAAARLVAGSCGVDRHDVACGVHVQRDAGHRVEDRGDVLGLHVRALPRDRDGPGKREVVAVFAAEARGLEVRVRRIEACGQLRQDKWRARRAEAKANAVKACAS